MKNYLFKSAKNSEAIAVLQDLASYKETLALLKILALGNQHVEAGDLTPAADFITRLPAKRTPE